MEKHKRETPELQIRSQTGVPNWENRTLFHADNLKILRGMNSESVHLIATDPPFKKGRDFHATPGSLADGASFQDRWSWDRDVHQDWVDQITDDFPKVMNVIQGSRNSYGDDMGAFLCFMAVRLLEIRRILRKNGSIYLHCDTTASHYLKAVMDAIFGWKNFRNEIVWCYDRWEASSNRFQKMHDIILFYSKFDNTIFNSLTEIDAKRQKTLDRGYTTNLLKDGTRQLIIYEGSENKPNIQKLKQKDKFNNIIVRPKEKLGRPLKDYWNINFIHPKSKERFGFPTQKPLSLYERIIKASSNEGDIVLDPFCGCATTLVAAERLKRHWVGIDIWDKSHEAIIKRMQKEGLAAPDGSTDGMLFTFGQIIYVTEPPERTDDGEEAVPFLKTKLRVDEPKGEKRTRAEMLDYLLDQYGYKCQGCDRKFDDPRYLELDHNTPRSDGGLNHISNRILLCGPCNKLKSNNFTLSGLRNQNKKLRYMAH